MLSVLHFYSSEEETCQEIINKMTSNFFFRVKPVMFKHVLFYFFFV